MGRMSAFQPCANPLSSPARFAGPCQPPAHTPVLGWELKVVDVAMECIGARVGE